VNYNRLNELIKKNEYGIVLMILAEYIEEHPLDEKVLSYRLQHIKKFNKFNHSYFWASDLLEINQESIIALETQIDYLDKVGSHREMSDIINKLLLIDEKNQTALKYRLKYSDHQFVLKRAREVIDLNIESVDARRILAIEENKNGEYQEALLHFKEWDRLGGRNKELALIGAKLFYNLNEKSTSKELIENNFEVEDLDVYDNYEFGVMDLLMRIQHSLHQWEKSYKLSQILFSRNINHKNSITCSSTALKHIDNRRIRLIDQISYHDLDADDELNNDSYTSIIIETIKEENEELILDLMTDGFVSNMKEAEDIIFRDLTSNNRKWFFNIAKGIKSINESKNMRILLAKIAVNDLKYDEAHDYCIGNLDIDPQDSESAYLLLKISMEMSEEHVLAAIDCNLTQRIMKKDINWGFIIAICLRNGKIKIAKELIEQFSSRLDKFGQRIRLGFYFFLEEDMVKTISTFEKIPIQYQKNSELILIYALALSRLGRHEESIKACEQIVNKAERESTIYTLYKIIGDSEKALDALNRTYQDNIKLSPIWIEKDFNFQNIIAEKYEKYDEGDLVTIIMGIHEWNQYLPLAVTSILNQTYSNLEILIIDDGSSNLDFKKYKSITNDKRVKIIRNKKNKGVYYRRNQGINMAKGKYLTFADGDDWNHPQRIELSLNNIIENNVKMGICRYLRITKEGYMHIDGGRTARFALVGMFWETSEIRDKFGGFDKVRVSGDSELYERFISKHGMDAIHRSDDILIYALHHSNSLTSSAKQKIDWMGPSFDRVKYSFRYRRWHHIINKYEDKVFPNNNNYQIPENLKIHKKVNKINFKNFKLNKKNKSLKSKNKKIIGCMATYPGGFKTLRKTVESLLFNQKIPLDKLKIHVNGKVLVPNLPVDKRLEIYYSDINMTDIGKFVMTEGEVGYILTVDDDIEYPVDYVEKMVEAVNKYAKKSIIGVHGSILPLGPPVSRFSQYINLRRSLPFEYTICSHNVVNLIGTGTMAYHTDEIKIPYKDFDHGRMVDLHIGVYAQNNKIPMIIIPRHRNWMKEIESEGERIWETANIDRNLQENMIETINRINFWTINDPNKENNLIRNNNNKFLVKWKNRELPINMILPPIKKLNFSKKNKKVTVYIPLFNSAKYIENTVKSALKQTYSNFEICIHDDGSTDNSLELVQHKFGVENKVKITYGKNKGIGGASNSAIENGDGDYILQLDSDDILEENAIEMLMDQINKDKTLVCVYGSFIRIDKNGKKIDDGWNNRKYSRERLMRSMIIHHPRLFTRESWEYLDGFNENLTNAVDYDFFLRLSEIGKFHHINNKLYSYRIHSTSTSINKRKIQTDNTKKVLNATLKRNNLHKEYCLITPNSQYPRRIEYIHHIDIIV